MSRVVDLGQVLGVETGAARAVVMTIGEMARAASLIAYLLVPG